MRRLVLLILTLAFPLAGCGPAPEEPAALPTTRVPKPTLTVAQPSPLPATPTLEPTPTAEVPPPLPTPTPLPPTPTPPALALGHIGQIGGASKAVAVQDHYAYLNVGPRLVIFDVADPAHPVVVGQSHPLSGIEGLAVTADYAYVAAGKDGVQVIDVSDPALPTVVGNYPTRGPSWSITLVETTAFVAAEDGLHILGMMDPTSPTDLGFFEMSGAALDVTVAGSIAYIAEEFSKADDQVETGGLRIVDVYDPAQAHQLGYYPMNPHQESEFEQLHAPGGAESVAVAGDYAYLTYSAAKSGGLRIVDISNPASPSEVGRYQDYIALVSDVTVVGDPTVGSGPVYAYLATSVNFGLLVLDVSDPALPAVLADEVPGSTEGIAVAGDRLFAADGFGGLHIADISNPALPVEIGTYRTLGNATAVVVSENTAYVTDGLRDLWLMDVSNPALPVLAGLYSAPGTIEEVTIAGTTAYIAAETAGLLVLDVSDPDNPTQIGAYDTPGLAHGVQVRGDHAFVADGQLQVLDVSEPASPAWLAVYEGSGAIRELILADATIYMPGQDLKVLDISDPAHPTEAGTYTTSGWAGSVAAEGNTAYVVSDGELHVLDVSSPGQPVQVGKLTFEDLPNWGVQMAMAGQTVYVAGEGRLHIVDVSDPAAPREASAFDFPGQTIAGLAAAGICVYVAAGAAGLEVLCH